MDSIHTHARARARTHALVWASHVDDSSHSCYELRRQQVAHETLVSFLSYAS